MDAGSSLSPQPSVLSPRLKRLGILLAVVIGFIVVCRFLAFPSIVWGDQSMTPTLQHGDFCLFLRCWHYQPHRGDIVGFCTANNPPLFFVKRVMALPGETIAIEHGKVIINGTVLLEPYTTPNSGWSLPATNVPPDRIYVIGDNRQDTAVQGIVATRLVSARVVWHGGRRQ